MLFNQNQLGSMQQPKGLEFFYELNSNQQKAMLESEKQKILDEERKRAILEEERRRALQQIAEQQELENQQRQSANLAQVAQDLYGKYETYQTFSGMFGGQGGGSFGGGMSPMGNSGMASWAGPISGGIAGLMAGDANYRNDPNMTNKRNDFGTKYPDLRAHVGGTILGATLGYFGGPVGAAFAGPAVTAAHYVAEPTTRALINFGDSWGGPGGALLMDPIGTISSGKYSIGELAKGFFLGPFSKLIK